MGAHSRPLGVCCEEPGCRALAREEVFNTYNDALGKFCKPHAARRVAELQRGERPGSHTPKEAR